MGGFKGTFDLDPDKIYEVIYPQRGKLYTAQMNQEQSKRGGYYFAIDLETLTPVLANGEQVVAMKPELTRPEVDDLEIEG